MVRSDHPSRLTRIGDGTKSGYSRYRCVCGVEKEIMDRHVRSKATVSCGCFHRELQTTHGKSRTKTYKVWCTMVARCSNPNYEQYGDYGGRGIKVDSRWLGYEEFLADMGECPPKMTLERMDNNKGYCLGNCKWATRREQSRNTRRNRNFTLHGQTMCLFDWCVEYKIHSKTVSGRLSRGWDFEKAITTPAAVQTGGRKKDS